MLRKKCGDVEWLEFEIFQEFSYLTHHIFLRHGGSSSTPLSSLNVGYSVGDDSKLVDQNLKMIQKISGFPLATSRQHHTAKVSFVEQAGCAGYCDGLITDKQGLGLLVKHADCQAALFLDPVQKRIGAIHCGWRGNVQNIYAEAVAAFQERGSKPQDLVVGISPSLGPTASEFKNYREELPEAFWRFQVEPTYFNLWEITRDQLEREGVLPHHIQIAEMCTFAEKKDFFSYRREKPTGRHATIIGIKSSSQA